MIKNKGYYIGEGSIYEDWHAGICFKSQKYSLIVFYDNGKVIKKADWIYLDNKEANLETFIKRVIEEISACKKETELMDRGFWLGDYKEYEKIVEVHFKYNDEVYVEGFTILSPEILLNNEMNDYKFVAFKKT